MVCWFHFVSMVTRTCIELAYTACFSKHCFVTAEFKIVISPADCGVWTHPRFYTDLRPCQRLLLTLAVDPHISIAFAYSFITSPCVPVRQRISRKPDGGRISATSCLRSCLGPPLARAAVRYVLLVLST